MADKSADIKHCLWVYYAGHGVMYQTNYIVLNEKKNEDRFYNLEFKIWDLTEHYKNTAAFIIFDCCRENITKDQINEKTEIQNPWFL